MRIEMVKQWATNLPGMVLDCRDGGAVTEGQADMLVRRGLARVLPQVAERAAAEVFPEVDLSDVVAAAAEPVASDPAPAGEATKSIIRRRASR
jgi:hypothetical protein